MPEIAARAHVEILPSLIGRCWPRPALDPRCRRHRGDGRSGTDRRRDGRAARRQGAGARGGQAAGCGQSPRRPRAVAAARRSRSGISLSAAARLGRPLPAARGRGRRRLSAARDDHRRRRRRSVRQGRQTARPFLSGRPGDRGAGDAMAIPVRSRCPARWSDRASRISHSPASKARSSAPWLRASSPEQTSPRASSRRWSIAWSTAPGSRLEDTMRRRWSSPAASRPTSRSAPRWQASRSDEGRRFSVPPAWLCTDNAAMIAWAGAERFAAGLIDAPRCAGARALAARSRTPRRCAARGSRHEARASSAAAPGAPRSRRLLRRAVARPCCGRSSPKSSQRSTGAKIRSSCRACTLNPAIRATGDLAELDGCDAWLVVTPAQHMRAVLGRAGCGKPLILCSKGIEESAGSCSTRSRARPARRRRWRCCPARPLRTKSPGAADRGHPGVRGLRRSAEQLRDRIGSRPSGFT